MEEGERETWGARKGRECWGEEREGGRKEGRDEGRKGGPEGRRERGRDGWKESSYQGRGRSTAGMGD